MGIVYQVQNKFESYGKPSYIMCPFFPACAKRTPPAGACLLRTQKRDT